MESPSFRSMELWDGEILDELTVGIFYSNNYCGLIL